MAKAKVWRIAALAFVLLISIVVFALTLAVFIELQNNNTARPNTPTDVPPAPTAEGASTATASASVSTATPSTASAWYSGRFTDGSTEWKDEWANPTSVAYSQQKSTFAKKIKDALVAAHPALYRDGLVETDSLSATRLDPVRSATTVHFSIGLPSPYTAAEISQDLSASSEHWFDVSVQAAGLPPLPQPGTSPGWRAAARMFLDSMNTTVNPCEDFFRYSCDNYISGHPLGNASSQSTFNVLQHSILANLTESFERLTSESNPDLPQTLRTTADMYTACKLAKNNTRNGTQLVLDIANAYGGWPLVDPDWNTTKLPNDIYWLMGDMLTRHGVATLFSPMVEINLKNVTSNNLLFLDQAELVVPAAYYNSPNLTDRYQEFLRGLILQTVKALDLGEPSESMLQQINRTVEIEYRLARISVAASDQRNMSMQFNPYTVAEASSEFNVFNWDSYLRGLIGPVFPNEDPSALLDPFVIAEPSYVRQLQNFLTDYAQPAAAKDLVNYLIFRLITKYIEFAGDAGSKVVQLLRRETKIDEVNVDGEQQKQCVAWLVDKLPYAAGRIYVDSYFPMQNRDDISVMINNVLSAFGSSLGGLNWMDNPSAINAFNKVAGLVRNVAYPDFQQDDAQLNAYYGPLLNAVADVKPDDQNAYFKYFSHTTLFQTQLMLTDLKKQGGRREFLMSPAVVNAWYQPERNSITFPAAILNPPFYQSDFPQAVNYGGLGVVMGHELSHGFDDQGVQFDADGTLNTWMTSLAEDGFKKMAECVVEEYSSFCYPQACLNGITTQGENIGDNGGLKAAYRAYKAYTTAHGEEKPLPGMETYTMDQIFFLSYGQVWCGSYSPDALTRLILTNPHCPGKDRVIGALRNFPKFAEAFKCKMGDPMYPRQPCDVW